MVVAKQPAATVPTAETAATSTETAAPTTPVADSGAAAVAAVATVTGHGLAVTAQQGDANHREENRDAKNQCSIHPRILQ
jgi:hypothetical protein